VAVADDERSDFVRVEVVPMLPRLDQPEGFSFAGGPGALEIKRQGLIIGRILPGLRQERCEEQ
jgi:hypothetical protein